MNAPTGKIITAWFTACLFKRLIASLFILCLATSAWARLGDTVLEIESQYGKPIVNSKDEPRVVTIGPYEKNGYRIMVGFTDGKCSFEEFQKIDPKKPGSYVQISEDERTRMVKENCAGCNWEERVLAKKYVQEGMTVYESTYKRSDGRALAVYDSRTMVFRIQSVTGKSREIPNQKEPKYVECTLHGLTIYPSKVTVSLAAQVFFCKFVEHQTEGWVFGFMLR